MAVYLEALALLSGGEIKVGELMIRLGYSL
jgi:hypothetical protein